MRSGFVSIIGRPNTGKSTLLNTVLKTHLAIVSNVAGTTRNAIQGVYNDEETQILFRDAIYAEQAAIARAVAAGYKKKDFDKIYIMVGSNNINDLKYLNKDVIIEFMEPSSLVYLYDLNRNEKILKVGNLLFNIY